MITSSLFRMGIPERLDFDPIIDGLEQNPKLPEVATKVPPVLPQANLRFDGASSACQSNDWLGSKNGRIKIHLLCHGCGFECPDRESRINVDQGAFAPLKS